MFEKIWFVQSQIVGRLLTSSSDEPEIESVEEEARIQSILENPPKIELRLDFVPDDLSPARFLGEMVTRVINSTPSIFIGKRVNGNLTPNHHRNNRHRLIKAS